MAYVQPARALQHGEHKEAAQGFSAFLESTDDPTFVPRAYYGLAQAEYALGNYNTALDALDDLELEFPDTGQFQVGVLRGDIHQAMGNQVDAVLYWESVWPRAKSGEKKLLQARIERSISEATVEQQRELALLLTELSIREMLPPDIVVAATPPEELLADTTLQVDAETLGGPDGEAAEPVVDVTTAATEDATERGDDAYAAGNRVEAVMQWETAWTQGDTEQRDLLRPRLEGAAKESSGEDLRQLNDLLTQPEVRAMFANVPAVPVLVEDSGASEATASVATNSKVGCVLPLTGPDRAEGLRTLSGLRLAFSDAHAMLVIRDSGGDPETAASVAADLAGDPRVLTIIGSMRAPTARAVAAVVDRFSVPLVLLSDDTGILGRFVVPAGFTMARPTGPTIAYAMQRLASRRFATLYPNDPYGRSQSEAFVAEVRRQGGTVIGSTAYPAGARDLAVQAEQVRGWMQGGGVHAVFIPDTAANAAAVALAVRTAEPTVVLLGTERWNDPEVLAQASTAVEGAVFSDYFYADSTSPAATLFASRFRTGGGSKPTALEAQAFDVAMLVRHAIENGAQTRMDLLEDLRTTGTYDGAGRLRSSPDGLQRDLFLLRVHQGRVEQVAAYDR